MCLKGHFVVAETEFKLSISHIYDINEVMIQIFRNIYFLRKVLRTVSEARKVAGSAKYKVKQSEIVLTFKVSLFIQS